MKRHIKQLFLVLAGAGVLVSCQDDKESFDNKIYNTTAQIGSIFVEEEADSYTRTLQAELAMPSPTDVTFTYSVDAAGVEWYNTAYTDTAELLPADYYEIPEPTVTIPAGEIRSSEVEVRFKSLLTLDKSKTYVLPVTIDGANISTLASRRTVYFVIKEASLVNVVANLRDNSVCVAKWNNAGPLQSLSQMTVEALVKVDAFADGRGSNISTLMGV